jgi:pilus assembly protein CpaB
VRRLSVSRPVLMLVAALACGLFAALAARQHIQGRIHSLEERARVPMVQRIVAAYDLQPGTRLQEEHLALRSFPAAWAAPASLAPENFRLLIGRQLVSAVIAGEPVLQLHTHNARRPAFSSQIRPGRRAITMPVDRINSVSGLLQPGDLIDLYVSFEYQRRTITAPLLQGVLVLATDTRTRNDQLADETGVPSYATVTLDAAPEDAVKLVAARHAGTLTAVLRAGNDQAATTKAARGDLASLLGVNRPPPPRSGKAQVIYGNRGAGSVARLQPGETSSARSGLFDLPSMQALVSAWAQSRQQAGFDASDPFIHTAPEGVQTDAQAQASEPGYSDHFPEVE